MSASSCSDDKEELTPEVPSREIIDSVQVSFQLEDAEGKPSTEFLVGENIVFNLTITNQSGRPLTHYFQPDYIKEERGDIRWDNQFFLVYSENGTYVGEPWTLMYSDKRMFWTFKESVTTVRCGWFGRNEKEVALATLPIFKVEEKDKAGLKAGNYYTRFTVSYNPRRTGAPDTTLEKEYFMKFTVKE